jgi:transcriptional regulator with XRE-family HTH domain
LYISAKPTILLTTQEQEELYNRLGQVIKAARVTANVNQEDLARHLGFASRISIANIESGRQKVQLHTLLDISDYLKIPLSAIVPSLETLREQVDPKLIKNIQKEVNDSRSVEKIKGFIRYSGFKK